MKRKTELKENENPQNKPSSGNCINIPFRQMYEIDEEDVEENLLGHPPPGAQTKVWRLRHYSL